MLGYILHIPSRPVGEQKYLALSLPAVLAEEIPIQSTFHTSSNAWKAFKLIHVLLHELIHVFY